MTETSDADDFLRTGDVLRLRDGGTLLLILESRPGFLAWRVRNEIDPWTSPGEHRRFEYWSAAWERI
jgi:hypothetical protein